MNKSAFLKLIQQASSISDQQTEELEKMAIAFPYCQTAHLLLAKSAFDKGSMLSTQRLRRAASYATNRQILKRVIHTSPAELVMEALEVEEQIEEVVTPASFTTASITESVAVEEIPFDDVPEESQLSNEHADLHATEGFDITVVTEEQTEYVQDEVSSTIENEIVAENLTDVATDTDAKIAYDASESELMSLLTISSLGTSFTDLLAQAPDPEIENEDQNYLLPIAEKVPTLIREDDTADEFELQQELYQPYVEEALPTEAQPEQASEPAEEILPEDAVIHYAPDEIERLYAEDALGYWMGSSRMGEQLQLKDEYTRPKPQSFHPELILEYNRTHELEKAIQPAANVLSQQLDIIEQFLKLNPRLKTMANLKLKEEPQEDLSLKSSKIKKSMASENLANIFIKQGKVKKAIKIYEQLILKNPEKKTYFAEQIEKLQNQI